VRGYLSLSAPRSAPAFAQEAASVSAELAQAAMDYLALLVSIE